MDLQDNLGEALDQHFQDLGFRTLRLRLGNNGLFNPMPFIGQPWTGDKYKKTLNRDVGYTEVHPSISSPIHSFVPFTTMSRAAALEGISVGAAVTKGQIYWFDQGDGVWLKYRLGAEPLTNNCRWLLILDLWLS